MLNREKADMISKKHENEKTDQAISHYMEAYDESKRLTDGFGQLNGG